MALSEPSEIVAVEPATSFLQWTPVVAGAFVAAAISLILIAFGSAIGLAVASSSPTWRDASPALAVGSGIYLLLTAIVSFGFGGYEAGRLRERWRASAHDDVVEFRDGTHGLVAWALAVVIIGLVAAASATSIASKAVQPAASPSTTSAETLIAYELDRLFRAGPRPVQGDLTYIRAEAGRILLTTTGRSGVAPEDRAYLVRLVAATTGIAQPDAERRVNDAIAGATTSLQKARRSAVILAFATAVALLAGAAAAWYAAHLGGRHRDTESRPLSWSIP